jgi:hypothetical protein
MTGPQISSESGPSQPYIPGEQPEAELEGPSEEDFPRSSEELMRNIQDSLNAK